MITAESHRALQRAVSQKPGPKARRFWIVTVRPDVPTWLHGQTERAATKSEARAQIKERFGLARLPVGTVVEEVK